MCIVTSPEEQSLYGKELAVFRSPRLREQPVNYGFYDTKYRNPQAQQAAGGLLPERVQGAAELNLGASLRELYETYETRRRELPGVLGETEARIKRAVAFLKKANRLTRRLTARQRRETGFCYHPSFFDSRLKKKAALRLVRDKVLNPGETPPELLDLRRSGELNLGELRMLGLMDLLKGNLLVLDLVEIRCGELALSVNKALEAFKHEYALIRRRLYPYFFFSFLCKHIRRLRGFPYFSSGDLKELAVLGELTGHVLKIADSPIL
jgi:hypothetical protein